MPLFCLDYAALESTIKYDRGRTKAAFTHAIFVSYFLILRAYWVGKYADNQGKLLKIHHYAMMSSNVV